jgi:hypothetical protein
MSAVMRDIGEPVSISATIGVLCTWLWMRGMCPLLNSFVSLACMLCEFTEFDVPVASSMSSVCRRRFLCSLLVLSSS